MIKENNKNEIITIKNVRGYIDEKGIAWLNLEDVARGLGFTTVATSGNEIVRWARVKGYLKEIAFPTSGENDFIPENIFYKLCMKAKNEVARKFQDRVCDEILPSIRKYGMYATDELLDNPDLIIKMATRLKEEKAAKSNSSHFDFATIFKTLRKPEYLSLVQEFFGEVPDVPNTKIFRVCYDLLSQITIEEFQKKVLKKLKEREISQRTLLISKKVPEELKYICNSLDFNKEEYKKMFNFLANNSLCTYPI